MEAFSNGSRSQINVAILGAVSAGKSTLLNTIFAETYSDCKIKRTTMTPQVYYESNSECMRDSKVIKNIKDRNTQINKRLYDKSKNNEPITMDDINEVSYVVPKVHGFTKLQKDVNLTVFDIPGLNDNTTKDLYFEYIEKNFYKFDIVIFVVDINSALNTSDEIDILVKIIENCKKNHTQHNIHNKLIVLANKCDEMYLEKKNLVLEEEHAEMFSQINNIVTDKVKALYPELKYEILPISIEDSYIYRMYDRNPKFDLDMKYVNKFGFNEYGKTRWNRLSEGEKRSKIAGIISKCNIKETFMITGFLEFTATLNNFLSKENQKMFVRNHIVYELGNINGNTKIDIEADIQSFYKFYIKCVELNKNISGGIDIVFEFKEYFSKYINTYREKIIHGFIEKKVCDIEIQKKVSKHKGSSKKSQVIKYDDCYCLKQESFSLQIEQAKNIIDNAVRMFNGDIPSLNELSKDLTDSLSHLYIKEINQKTKPITSLFGYLAKLVENKFVITKNLICSLFTNPDMLNKKPAEIVAHLDKLESNGHINCEEKINHLIDIIKNVYTKINNKSISNTFLDHKYIPYYSYFSYLFWNRLMTFYSQDKSIHFQLHAMAICNYNTHCMSGNSMAIMDLSLFEDNEDLMILENYYQALITNSSDPESISMNISDTTLRSEQSVSNGVLDRAIGGVGSIIKRFVSESDYEGIDAGNISDDLDAELGLNQR